MARELERNLHGDPAHAAAEIRAGALSLREAFDAVWTFQEDLEFWDLPARRSWRAVRPDRRSVLAATARLLPAEGQQELVELLLECHAAYRDLLLERERKRQLEDDWDPPWRTDDTALKRLEEHLDSGDYYNPFCDDLWLAAELVKELAIPLDPGRTAALARQAKALELQRFPVLDLRAPRYDEEYEKNARSSARFHALSRFGSWSEPRRGAREHPRLPG